MNDDQFRVFLDLLMVSDPWPLEYGHEALNELADEQSRERGYCDWIEAYHKFEHLGMRQAIG